MGQGLEGRGSLPRQDSNPNNLRGTVRKQAMRHPIAYAEASRLPVGARANCWQPLAHIIIVFSSLLLLLGTARSGFSVPEAPNTLDVGKKIYRSEEHTSELQS